MFREQEVALLAMDQFAQLVGQIDDSKWDMTMPDSYKTRNGEPTTLRAAINYHAYDDAWIPDMLAGHTMDEVGAEKWKGDLLGDDPKARYAEFNGTARNAIEKLEDGSGTAHCSFGDFSVADYLTQVISFRGLRAYDIPKALGMNTTLPDDLVQGMWDTLTPHAEAYRAYGVYGPRIDVPEDAPLQQRLLGLLGYE